MTIFLNNKYTKYYYDIINRAKTRTLKDYKENHHIIPKCFFVEQSATGWLLGDPDDNNTVIITAREHFICHWLLTKMQPTTPQKAQMIYAFNMMSVSGDYQERYNTKISSRAYEKNRILLAETISKNNKGKIAWNKGYKETRLEVLENVKQAALKRQPQSKESRELQASKTRGQKRTVKQKENHSKILKEYYEEHPRGPMSADGKRIRSESAMGKAKPSGMGDKLSATIAKQLAEGTHYSQNKKQCPYCPVKASKGKYNKYHGNKCKQSPNNTPKKDTK